MKIAVLRHGKPEIDVRDRMPASEFSDWINAYDDASLSRSSLPESRALACAIQSDVIVSSTLKRSIDSARALDAEKLLLTDADFVEAGLPAADWTSPRMSPTSWAIVFRLMWLFGYSKSAESYMQAKQRASTAATKLIELARQHGQVLFVGHGVFNRLLVKELRRRGWSGPASPGTGHWSFALYEHSGRGRAGE